MAPVRVNLPPSMRLRLIQAEYASTRRGNVFPVTCPAHPKYRALAPPTNNCASCHRMWGLRG
jgi:hypothetical protein